LTFVEIKDIGLLNTFIFTNDYKFFKYGGSIMKKVTKDLEKLLLEKGVEAIYLPSFDAIETYLLENLASGDLCITMGAGDIVKVGEKLVGK